MTRLFSYKHSGRITFAAFLILLFLLIWINYRMVSPYFIAVLMGAILSVLSRPVFRRLQAWGIGPKVSSLIICIGVTLVVVLPVFLFGLIAVTQAIELARHLLENPKFTFENLMHAVSGWAPLKSMLGNAAAVETEIKSTLKSVASVAPGVVFSVFGSLPELVLQLVLGLISCYFFLIDGHTFLNWLRDKIPLDPQVRGTIFTSFRETAVSAILSTITAALAQTTIIVTGFLALGVPAAFLAGGATFILAWVPLVGSTPVWLAAALYLFVNGLYVKAALMIGVGCLTGISDNIVYPLVLKGRAEMHPLVSLVAIFGGISLFGIFGVFIGPVLAALLIATMNIWPTVAERFGFGQAQSVAPATTAEMHTLPSEILLPPNFVTDNPS